jgi:hypothetical protein
MSKSLISDTIPRPAEVYERIVRVPAKSLGWFRGLEKNCALSFRLGARAISRIARRRATSVLLIGSLSFLLSASFALLVRMPQPLTQDEFSYLLAADTFAHGRLTSPPHPLWPHFESMHIIQQPTYASKYPPAQGLVLAAGQAITGYPIVGVWLSTALACAATCWMLMAWMPSRWALVGGLLAILHPALFSWSQSYWGGSVAMLGGALCLGAARRIVAVPKPRHGLILGLGLLILANSRPYEGLVFSLVALAATLIGRSSRKGPSRQHLLRSVALPSLVVLAIGAAGMGYYNYRVTGSAFRLPYIVHEATYGMTPLFVCQDARPEPNYRHPVMRDFHRFYLHDSQRTASQPIKQLITSRLLTITGANFHYPLLPMVLAILPCALKDPMTRIAAWAWAGFATALIPESWMHAHYAAPAFSLAAVLELRAIRHLRAWHRCNRPSRRLLLPGCLVLCVVSLVSVRVLFSYLDGLSHWRLQISQRSETLARLGHKDSDHLVIVRYGPGHPPDAEWVYNESDIDHSRVVWAREMEPAQNQRLLHYFKNRKAWLLEPDGPVPRLSPYPMP